jgi:hypothetical protein
MPANAAHELPVLIEVAKGGLSVRLVPRPDRVLRAIDAPEILAHLARMGVLIDAGGEAEIAELCRPRKAGRVTPSVIVASGTACVNDVPPCLEFTARLAQLPEGKRYVKAGEPVATLFPARAGSDGIDVFGKPIVRRQAAALPPVDASLTPSADGMTYHAASDGIIRMLRSPASGIIVLPCFTHSGDFLGTAEQSRSIQSPGECTIDGRAMYAKIEAGGAIHIAGEMENSTAICDGDLTAGTIRCATIDVTGNCIASGIVQSRVACGGELIVENGHISGGHILAARGLTCKSLGSPPAHGMMAKMIVEIGIDHRFRQRVLSTLPETEVQLAKATKIRQLVEPLLSSVQPLTPKQQARVTELLAEADALEADALSRRRELREEYDVAIARCRNEISIAQIVHPGVTIRFPGAQTTVRIALRGPCRISLQGKNNEPPRIILSQGATAIPMELNTLTEDWRTAVKQLAA